MRELDLADTAKEVGDENFVWIALEEILSHAHRRDTLPSRTCLKLSEREIVRLFVKNNNIQVSKSDILLSTILAACCLGNMI